jgi:RHS repeat-associated protein
VVLPDNSTTTYVYQGNWYGITDPAGVWKSWGLDPFGNVIDVLEPDPALGDVETGYSYDVLNHLTYVYMPRGSNTQTRTFNYNSGTTVTGCLQSATNPENGTVNYTYYPGTCVLKTKTDARGVTLTYAYDGYSRLTSVSSGSTVLRTYYYDINPLQSGFSQNALGRLTAVQYPTLQYENPQYAWQNGPQMNEMYSYIAPGSPGAGLPATKRVQVNQPYAFTPGGNPVTETANLDTTFTYNSEGKITSMTYPSTVSGTTVTAGPSYNYSYDSMYRLSGMTSGSNTIVNGVSYNAANQLLGMTYSGVSESRTYNALNQLNTVSAEDVYNDLWLENLTYNYPTGANNGKISSTSNAISGETVSYTYDSLNRLYTASGCTQSGGCNQQQLEWGEQYGFDSFGNLKSKTVTAGQGPSLSQVVSPVNNQISGYPYDANGNTTATYIGNETYNLVYDAENRLTLAGLSSNSDDFVEYFYDAQNRRIFSWIGFTEDSNYNMINYLVSIYSPSGQKLATYTIAPSANYVYPSYYMQVTRSSSDLYFGGRRLAAMDQLGSALNSTSQSYFPWGEPKGTSNPQDTWNFATYWADSFTGLDYASNRYYSNAYGRFMTPDPSGSKSANPRNPLTWNRYAYVAGDPVNRFDPSGLFQESGNGPSPITCTIGGGDFSGAICESYLSSFANGYVSGGWWTSSYLNNAITAAMNYAAAWQQLGTESVQARSLLDAALQLPQNAECMSWLETATGKSSSQLMQDANGLAFIDITGVGGSLTMSDVGVPGGNETLSQYFYSAPCPAPEATCPPPDAAVPLGYPVVLLGAGYFNSNGTTYIFGNQTYTPPATTASQEAMLFHEFFHTEGIGDLGGSNAFDSWLQGGCKGSPPGQ